VRIRDRHYCPLTPGGASIPKICRSSETFPKSPGEKNFRKAPLEMVCYHRVVQENGLINDRDDPIMELSWDDSKRKGKCHGLPGSHYSMPQTNSTGNWVDGGDLEARPRGNL
jgi:hypothetical protein